MDNKNKLPDPDEIIGFGRVDPYFAEAEARAEEGPHTTYQPPADPVAPNEILQAPAASASPGYTVRDRQEPHPIYQPPVSPHSSTNPRSNRGLFTVIGVGLAGALAGVSILSIGINYVSSRNHAPRRSSTPQQIFNRYAAQSQPQTSLTYQQAEISDTALNRLYEKLVNDSNDAAVLGASERMRQVIDVNYNNPQQMQQAMQQFGQELGYENAWSAFVFAQRPSNIPMPTGSEFREYARDYAKTTGASGIVNIEDPDELSRMLFSHSMDSVLWSSDLRLSIASIALRSFGKELGYNDFQEHVKRWDRVQGGTGYIAAFKNAYRRYPQTWEELYDLQWRGAASAKTYNPSEPRPAADYHPTERRSESPSSTTVTQEFNPTLSDSEQRNMQRQNLFNRSQQQINQQGRENLKKFENDVRQKGGQVIDKLKEAAKPPPKKPPGR